jgi:hypothetical protein
MCGAASNKIIIIVMMMMLSLEEANVRAVKVLLQLIIYHNSLIMFLDLVKCIFYRGRRRARSGLKIFKSFTKDLSTANL